MAKWTNEQREAARERLGRLGVEPGTRVYTVLRSVSRSGMSRTMSVHVVHGGELYDVTRSVAVLTDNGEDKRGNLRVAGAGMDMGFAVVYALGHALYPDRTDRYRDGGYALRQVWA